MADESFHLTPLDIRRFDFGSALRGYDRARVDQFREQVAAEVERLTKQVQSLEARAQGFHEQLRAFRERDKAINEALISAQQLRAETREQSEREAQLILREARAEGERLVAQSRSEASKLEAELDGLQRQRRSYLLQMRGMIERQLADVEAAEVIAPPVLRIGNDVGAGATSSPAWLDSLDKD
jgi:DivIVA domain-containing protein